MQELSQEQEKKLKETLKLAQVAEAKIKDACDQAEKFSQKLAQKLQSRCS